MSESAKLTVSPGRLNGLVRISGAKNSALKLLSASVLTDELVQLDNFPTGLLDIQVHLRMLNQMGKSCVSNGDSVTIAENSMTTSLTWDERSIRNSLLILGCLVSRFGEGKVPLPGGCKLGDRKYDIHVTVLESFGASIWEDDHYLYAKMTRNHDGCEIHLPIRSTGATENAIFCAVLANGESTIWNPHIRPEVVDLVNMLRKMGAKVEIFGQQCIRIQGVKRLAGVRHSVIPDNMEALTWAIGSVITNGDVEIENFPFDHLDVPLVFLRESGMKCFRGTNSLVVKGGRAFPIEISTGPYPGINSDMQPLFAVYGSISKGQSKIIDLRFPGRYGYVEELSKMGLQYRVEGDMLLIEGGRNLTGTEVNAIDLRAGISLLLAGLTADGETTIYNHWQIKRGYENLTSKLGTLGVAVYES